MPTYIYIILKSARVLLLTSEGSPFTRNLQPSPRYRSSAYPTLIYIYIHNRPALSPLFVSTSTLRIAAGMSFKCKHARTDGNGFIAYSSLGEIDTDRFIGLNVCLRAGYTIESFFTTPVKHYNIIINVIIATLVFALPDVYNIPLNCFTTF